MKPPKRMGRWGCVGMLVGTLIIVPILTLSIAGGVYQFREWRHNAIIAAAVREIREKGEPTTHEEFEAMYAIPDGVPDTSDLWITGLSQLGTSEYATDAGSIPIVGTGTDPIPAAGEPWPELDQARQFLATYQPALEAFEQATTLRGAACFSGQPSKFFHKHSIATKRGEQLLELAAAYHAFEGDSKACAAMLRTTFGWANCTRRDYGRVTKNRRAFTQLERLLTRVELSDDDLMSLQSELPRGGLEESLLLMLLGDQSHLAVSALNRKNGDPSINLSFYEMGKSEFDNFRLCLGYKARYVNAARESWPQAFESAQQITTQAWAEMQANGVLGVDGGHALSTCDLMFRATTGAMAQRNAADAALGAERFRLATGRLPESLEALVPTYLARVPIDPFDGAPLRYKLNEDGSALIYSVGADRRDDGGQMNEDSKPDVAFRLPARAGAK